MIIRAVGLAAAVLSTAAFAATIDVSNCDAGDVYASTAHHCTFALNNNGDQPVHLTDIHALRSDDKVEKQVLTISAHGSANLSIDFNLLADSGETMHSFEFSTD